MTIEKRIARESNKQLRYMEYKLSNFPRNCSSTENGVSTPFVSHNGYGNALDIKAPGPVHQHRSRCAVREIGSLVTNVRFLFASVEYAEITWQKFTQRDVQREKLSCIWIVRNVRSVSSVVAQSSIVSIHFSIVLQLTTEPIIIHFGIDIPTKTPIYLQKKNCQNPLPGRRNDSVFFIFFIMRVLWFTPTQPSIWWRSKIVSYTHRHHLGIFFFFGGGKEINCKIDTLFGTQKIVSYFTRNYLIKIYFIPLKR